MCCRGGVLESASIQEVQEGSQRDTVAAPADLCGNLKIGDGVREQEDQRPQQSAKESSSWMHIYTEVLFMQWKLWQSSVSVSGLQPH